MHSSPMLKVGARLLWGSLILISGCDGVAPQTFALTFAATPLAISTSRTATLKAVARLRAGAARDVTANTHSMSSDSALTLMNDGALKATASDLATFRATFVPPASTSGTTAPSNVGRASTHVTITKGSAPNALDIPILAWNSPAAIPTVTTPTPAQTASAAGSQTVLLGNNVTDTNGRTSANAFNSIYAVTGSNSTGYTVASGTMCFAPGTVTKGKSTDIGVVPAASPTTEASSALCSATYTHTSSTSPGCVTVSLAGCGTLKPETAYWIFSITNDPISGSPYYFTDCGGGCTSTVPTSNVGNYHSFYVGRTYGGPYTNLPASFAGPNTYQVSNSISLLPITQAATPVITWAAPVPVASGTRLSATQLNATANVPGRFVYSPAAGVVLVTGTQPLRAVFVPTDTTNYSSTSVYTSLVVNPASVPTGGVPTITWNTPPAITYGTALSNTELNATANVPGAFIYTPRAGTVLRAGPRWHTVSVTFTPTDTAYSATSASVHLIVNQATPVISWATPASISPGTALSAAQLDAKASVPGRFTYNPVVGTVLSEGTRQLTAVFSPADATDYSSATARTSVVVSAPSAGPTPTPVPVAPGPPPSPEDPAGGCRLAAGASTSAIQTAINSAANNSCAAPSASTVLFAAGNYTISSQIFIPCPKTAMVIQGTTPSGVGTTWPITPTAILTSTLTDNWAFRGSACAVGTTVQYLQFNGGNPSGGGGGFFFVPAGMNNLTVTYNWFYGNSAIASTSQFPDTSVWLDGDVSSARTAGVTIKWNRFGNASTNDCAALMNLYGGGNHCSSSGYGAGSSPCLYQGAQDITHGGGSCGGVGVHVNTDNLNISNNSFEHLEQPLKLYEAPGNGRWTSNNTLIQYNDLAGTHRIGLEAQAGVNLLWTATTFTTLSSRTPDSGA